MIQEHALVVVVADLPDRSLRAGDVGTVVHVHAGDTAYEVEFTTLNGRTVRIETLRVGQVRAATGDELLHVRSD